MRRRGRGANVSVTFYCLIVENSVIEPHLKSDCLVSPAVNVEGILLSDIDDTEGGSWIQIWAFLILSILLCHFTLAV